MTIKLIPVSTKNPTNLLRVMMEYMHGDADAYTNETFDIALPNVDNKEELIGRVLEGISYGLDLMDEYNCVTTPFIIHDDDWNSSNIDEDGIPLVGAKVHFVREIKHDKYWTETRFDIGTVVEANTYTVTVEFNGSTYVVPNNEDSIAPESATAVIVDGLECKFTVDGIEVHIEGEGDCTCDGAGYARPGIDEIIYFDENGHKFTVANY